MPNQGSVSAEAYRLCFEHLPWPALLIDRTQLQVLDANQACRNLFVVLAPLPQALNQLWRPQSRSFKFGSALSPQSRQGRLIGELKQANELQTWQIQNLDASHALLYLQGPDPEAERLRAESQRKSELIANLSHELRTPLTAILGWPEIVLDAPDMPPLALQAAQAIRKDALFLYQLLDDLIDLSRIEAGHLLLEIHTEDLGQIVLDAVEMLSEKAQQKSLQIQTHLPDDRLWVAVDPVRMLQVVLNYLTNAIKYTQQGGQIEIELRSDGSDAILSLQDNGIGIEEDLQQHIFERFIRANEVKLTSGAGIGLSLVKKLVELHGGRCWVKSTKGQGSTFYVSLPLSHSGQKQQHYEAPVSLDLLAQARIVLINERPEELELLSQMLQAYVAEIESFTELPELSTLKAHSKDLILLSSSLLHSHHQPWLQNLQQQPDLKRLPVIALSSSAMKGDVEKLEQWGFSASLKKPFLKEDLLQCMEHILARTAQSTDV